MIIRNYRGGNRTLHRVIMKQYIGFVLLLLVSSPASAFPAIFSNQDYTTTEHQCKDVAAFTRAAIIKALRPVNQQDIDYSFKFEWGKRKIPAKNGAYIDSKYDKDLYTWMANYADKTVRALSVVARKDDNSIDLSRTPPLENIYSECVQRNKDILQYLQSSWSVEIEEAKATENEPASPRYILGERDFNNIKITCDKIADETHQRVMLAIKSNPNLHDARQAYFGQSKLINWLEGASENSPTMNLFLPNGQRYKSKLKGWNQNYARAIFNAVSAKEEPISARAGAEQCQQLSYDFWMSAL